MLLLLLYLLLPMLGTCLIARTVYLVAGISPLKVSRTLAMIPTGLAIVALAAAARTNHDGTGMGLVATAFLLAFLSLGAWLATLMFWLRRRRQEPAEDLTTGPGLSSR